MKKYPLLRFLKKITSLPGLRALLPDAWYLRALYHIRLNRPLNLRNPQAFNEKLQWLKLYDRNPLYTQLVDKYAVREYVADKIGAQYLVPLLAPPCDAYDQIDFSALPERFVLKCNHDSGSVVICHDKSTFDHAAARAKLTKALKRNCYWLSREYPYRDVPPKIIVEQYLENSTHELTDYKFLCFHGKALYSFVGTERFAQTGLKLTFFDREWNRLPFERHYRASEHEIPKPRHYEQMLRLAETLAQDFIFVRVDFYDLNDQIYFGELTFYPGGGLEEFSPEEWDFRIGDALKLPDKKTLRIKNRSHAR